MTAKRRWVNRPEGSTWGDFGAEDQQGRLNLITAKKVLQGVAEVREGKSFCLSLPLDYPGKNVLNPRRLPPVLRPTSRNGRPNLPYVLARDDPNMTDVICDDLVIMHLQYSTQWDSLAHVGSLFDADGDGVPEPVFYNGFRAGEHIIGPSEAKDAGLDGPIATVSTSNAAALSVARMAETCIQGRGVMIDLHAHVKRLRIVFGYERLMRVLDADKVEIETGDMVLIHTGFADMLLEMKGDPDPGKAHSLCAVLNGRDKRLLKWITDTGLAALIADNYGVEAVPAVEHEGCCAALPLHEHCLFKLGVNLGELWHLTPLAMSLRANERYRFLLTAPPLRLPGAVGSPATPVATV
jgi:kynurenine formamidase